MAPTLRPCREGCGELILLAKTDNARPMQLNPQPDPDGRIAVVINHMDNVTCRQLRKDERAGGGEQMYMVHKATCQVELARRGLRARQTRTSVTDLATWRAAQATRAAARRAGRYRRAAPPVTGVRWRPPQGRDR